MGALSAQQQEEARLQLAIADAAIKAGEPGAVDEILRDVSETIGLDLSGNKNPYVPWSDPQIPYHCECGKIIYADTEHLHPEDEAQQPT